MDNPQASRQPTSGANWFFASATLAILCCGCGGEFEEKPLFSGTPGELIPHELGQTSRFLVRVAYDGRETSAILTSRVLHEGPHGEFIVENSFDDGRTRRLRVRETADTIQVEALARRGTEGFFWKELDEPAVVVTTPVILGESRKEFFTRMIDLEFWQDEMPTRTAAAIEGNKSRTAAAIEGKKSRTALPTETLPFGETTVEVIPFEIRSSSRFTGLAPAFLDSLAFDLRGIEYLSPGLGLVREFLELTLKGDSASPKISISTERLPPTPSRAAF